MRHSLKSRPEETGTAQIQMQWAHSFEGRPSHTAHGNQRLPKISPQKPLDDTHSLVLEVTSVLLAARSLNCLLLCCLPVDPSNENTEKKKETSGKNKNKVSPGSSVCNTQMQLTRQQTERKWNSTAGRAMARANGHRAYASYGHFKLALLHFA